MFIFFLQCVREGMINVTLVLTCYLNKFILEVDYYLYSMYII